MKGSFKTALIAALVSAFVAAGAAVATTKAFVLGATNTVDAPTTVSAGAGLNAKMLQLTNNSTGSSATALGLTTSSSRPPMIVSSGAKVANLNVDKLDGIDSTGFLPKTGKAVDADKLDGLDTPAFQKRVSGNCALGSAIRSIATNGAVTCQAAGGSLTGTACTRAGGGTASVVMRVRRDNTIELTCETATGYQSLAVTEEVAQTVADFLVGGVRDLEVSQNCANAVSFGCVGGQPVSSAPTIPMTGFDVFVDPVSHQRRFDGKAIVTFTTVQPVPIRIHGIDCLISIDTRANAAQVPFQLDFVNLEDPTSTPNRIGVSNLYLSVFTDDQFVLSGGIFCTTLNLSALIVADLITTSIIDQMAGGLCGAPGPDLYMRCTQG